MPRDNNISVVEGQMFKSHKGKLTEAAASCELKVVVAASPGRLTAVDLKRATGISKSHVGRLLVGEVGILRIEEHGISYWCSGKVRDHVSPH